MPTPQLITSFSGPYRFLSNFYEAPVAFEGLVYPTSEHAFAAAKTTDQSVREIIRSAATPGQAKRLGRGLDLRLDWEMVKDQVMATILEDKFTRNADLREKLVGLVGFELIEGNTWGDRTWGAVWHPVLQKWEGQNRLGIALMALAKKLQ